MAAFTIEYTRTEIVRERVTIDAASEAEAVERVESYQFDNSLAWEVESVEWTLANARAVESE